MKWVYLFFMIPSMIYGELFWKTEEKGMTIQLHLSSAEINLEEQVNLQLSLQYPTRYTVNSEELLNHLLWHINPLQPQWKIVKKEISSSDTEQHTKQLINLSLKPVTTGTLSLSFLNIPFTSIQESPIEIFTPIFEIKVQLPNPIPTSDQLTPAPLFPLIPQFPINLTLTNHQRIMGPQALALEARRNQAIFAERSIPWFSLIFLSLLGVGWFAWKKIDESRKQAKAQAKVVSPKDKALQALEKLQREDWSNPDLYKNFYIQMTNILRKDLEESFHLPVTTKTTDEFLHDVYASTFLPRESKELLSEILYQADQVKFAHYQPNTKDTQQIYQTIKDFILKL